MFNKQREQNFLQELLKTTYIKETTRQDNNKTINLLINSDHCSSQSSVVRSFVFTEEIIDCCDTSFNVSMNRSKPKHTACLGNSTSEFR